MAGKKGRSGPPNNTNATRYSWRLLWRRALLRPEDQWVGRPLDLYTAALLKDKPDATAGERNMIEVAATAKGCVMLIMNELKKSGFMHKVAGAVELTPAAKELRGFLQCEIQAHRVLGMERRLRAPISLGEYLNGTSTPTPPSPKAPPITEVEPEAKTGEPLTTKAAWVTEVEQAAPAPAPPVEPETP